MVAHQQLRQAQTEGVRISELLPRLAERADRLAIVRGMSSAEGSHDRAQELVHTGRTPNPTVDAPSLGAWTASAEHGVRSRRRPTSGAPSRRGQAM